MDYLLPEGMFTKKHTYPREKVISHWELRRLPQVLFHYSALKTSNYVKPSLSAMLGMAQGVTKQ